MTGQDEQEAPNSKRINTDHPEVLPARPFWTSNRQSWVVFNVIAIIVVVTLVLAIAHR